MNDEMGWSQVQAYLETLVPARHPEMEVMEEYGRRTRFPIIGPAAGFFCYQTARLMQARRVFELGSGFGYSTSWFARAVKENGGGEVYHVVWDEELSRQARGHMKRLGYEDIVRFEVGEAVESLRRAEGQFDLIFNDINKEGYPDSLPVIESRLRPGGVLLVDNALWHGRIFDPADNSGATVGVRSLTRRLTGNPRWITSLLPIRDGLFCAFRV